jgi:outer membrane protein TolC
MDQYRQGNSSALQVKDAQNSLFELEESEAQALYDAHIARIQLLKAVGTLAPESIQ